ncbi:unnamed protein product [Heligmosomoides polygyrus]|uniref:Uncharacterized protein n=1 Tax=Heligmosomoides polygyrus TaxID=6339 RepID=A0A3P8FBL5_HELPZ|nr:unnamed protein product [Heligmosomoides polygyrus]
MFHIYAYDPKVHMAEVERIIEASELDKNFTVSTERGLKDLTL